MKHSSFFRLGLRPVSRERVPGRTVAFLGRLWIPRFCTGEAPGGTFRGCQAVTIFPERALSLAAGGEVSDDVSWPAQITRPPCRSGGKAPAPGKPAASLALPDEVPDQPRRRP